MFPDDWCSLSLGEAEGKGIVSLGRGDVISRIYLADHPGSYPVYSSSAKGDGMFGKCSTHMFDEELITWSIDGGGRFFYRPRHRFSVTNVCGYLRLLTPDLDPRFLHASLDFQHQRIHFDYQSKAHPSVIRRLYRVLLPPLPEQKKIAAILSAVDEAIQAKRAVIEQTRYVKEGLLQDLLTKGIGHTRFKQTEIGEIPEGWEVRRVESLLANVHPAMRSGPFGSALLKSELVAEGIPLLGIDNVHVGRFVPEYRRFVTEEKFEELRRYAIRPGDVMITIMGTVGRCCQVPEGVGRALSSKHTWTLTFDQDLYLPYLACSQFNHARWALQHFERDQQGGTMDAIRSETLRSLPLPVPPLEEQIRIEAVLRSVDEESTATEQQLTALERVKAGLLQDLLTGKVRVSV